MKQQKITKLPEKVTKVIDERRPQANSQIENAIKSVTNTPVRAVVFVEVGDMDKVRLNCMLQELNSLYKGNRSGVHYVLPVRHGKLNTDIIFESEILDFVNSICEIKDGKIALKDGLTEVTVIRELVK